MMGESFVKWAQMQLSNYYLEHDCVDFWRETVVVAPDDGMCKATTPGVKQSRASQWRARANLHLGASVDMLHCDYG